MGSESRIPFVVSLTSGLIPMTAANDPASSGPTPGEPRAHSASDPGRTGTADGKTVLPAVDDTRVPLPPIVSAPRARPTSEQLAGELARLDLGIVALTLVLAFLLASFAVRNADFWLHLATGRLIAQGQYEFGRDPFSYMTTSSTY